MSSSFSRFQTAAFCAFLSVLAGCGGGSGGGALQSAAVIPMPARTQAPALQSGPVAYMQNSGPDASEGTLPAGTSRAIVAVMSGNARASQTFAQDTLQISSPGQTQSAARRPASAGRAIAAPHVAPVEAFPADDRALLERRSAFAVQGAGGAAPRRRAQSITEASGAQQQIWVQRGSLGGARTNIQVPATLLGRSAHANIWADQSIAAQITPYLPQIEADVENAYASDTEHFASPDYPSSAPGLQPQYSACGADGSKQGTTRGYIAEPADGRIDVMIVGSQNLGGLGGYFSAANLMPQAALNCLKGGYESNEGPFIFVGWFPGNGTTYELDEDLVRSTAHELQHLINFVHHGILAPGASSPSFDGNELPFINEGLSMLAQDLAVQRMYGAQGVQFDAADALERASAYLADPGNFSVSGFSGIDSAAWGGNGSTAQYNCAGGCYGGAYLFQRYLRDRFGGDAYTRAVETGSAVGTQNLQNVTGESAGSLLDDFALAMAAGSIGVKPADPRFDFGTLDLMKSYPSQVGTQTQLQGVYALASSGAASVQAPVGGFTFVSLSSVPASGMPVQVTDEASAGGFALSGGLAQQH